MTRDELISVVKGNTHHSVHFNAIMTAVDAYLSASNGAKSSISGSLPCHHNFIQKDTYWKSCTHCGMLAPSGQ